MTEFAGQAGFWDRDKKLLVGDYLNREQAVALAGSVAGLAVLEAGCGSGYVARRLAQAGAAVSACDLEPEMVRIAKGHEGADPLGIRYDLADIARLPYPDAAFNVACCISVLMYCEEAAIRAFFGEAVRVLKPGGKLIFSVTHPHLFRPGSPVRTGAAAWLHYELLGPELPYGCSQLILQHYVNKRGETFRSSVWHHPCELYLRGAEAAGLQLEHVQSVFMTQNVARRSPYWGDKSGYPAYYQVRAAKEGSRE